eukprot:Awhi_evm1s10691
MSAWGNTKPMLVSDFLPPEQFPILESKVLNSHKTDNQPAGSTSSSVSSPNSSLNLGYSVSGSKKGGFPVQIEKRAKGKKVTVIRNITGDPTELLLGLKKKLGSGGVIIGNTIEIQGEHQSKVETYLMEKGCVKAVSSANKAASAPPPKAKKIPEK